MVKMKTKKDDLTSQILKRYGPSRYVIGESHWKEVFSDIIISKNKCPQLFKTMRLLQFFEQGYYLFPLLSKNLDEINHIGELNLLRESSRFQYDAQQLLSSTGRNEYVLFGSIPLAQSNGISIGQVPSFLLNSIIKLVPEIMTTEIGKKWKQEVEAVDKEIWRGKESLLFEEVLRTINQLDIVKTLLPNVSEVAQLMMLVNKTYGEYLFSNHSVLTRDRYSPTEQAVAGFYDQGGMSILKQDVRSIVSTNGIVLTIPISILFDVTI